MAKDGTVRGGARQGAGRRKKPIAEKLLDGQVQAEIPTNVTDCNMPPPKEYMQARQTDDQELEATSVYQDTWDWLCRCNCEKLVNPQLIEDYAMSVSRWIQCENAISIYGFIGKHPTTAAPIASPYVTMAQNYMKQINQTWYAIYQIVRDNAADCNGSPQDDLMERLLQSAPKKGKG